MLLISEYYEKTSGVPPQRFGLDKTSPNPATLLNHVLSGHAAKAGQRSRPIPGIGLKHRATPRGCPIYGHDLTLWLFWLAGNVNSCLLTLLLESGRRLLQHPL